MAGSRAPTSTNGAAMPTDEDDQDGNFFFNHPERGGYPAAQARAAGLDYSEQLDWTTQAIGQQHTSPLRAGCEARRREIVVNNRTATVTGGTTQAIGQQHTSPLRGGGLLDWTT